MDEDMKKSYEIVRVFADDILQQCQEKGLTFCEVQFLPNALSRKIDDNITNYHQSNVFLKSS